jgi:peptidoglycan/LPS O-acetylase OafA/YrhL
VLAVLLYHGGVAWAPGGFLGVEVFFVLSGFLITSLLVAEWQRTSTIALGAFWARRARRLLPPLFCLVAVIGIYYALAGASQAIPAARCASCWVEPGSYCTASCDTGPQSSASSTQRKT